MELTRKLGDHSPKGHSTVCHRINNNNALFEYSLTNDGNMQCSEGVPCINLKDLREYCLKERSGTAKVLV
jgi:hypothetical protein